MVVLDDQMESEQPRSLLPTSEIGSDIAKTERGARRLRFAIITSPVRGHFNPLLALARAIQQRGGIVTFVHVADAAALIGDASVGFRAVGAGRYPPGALSGYTAQLGKASGLIGIMKMVRATARLSDMLCDELPQAIQDIGADVVLADVAEPSGALVARHLKLPYIGVMVALPLHPDPIVPPPFLSWGPDASSAGRRRVRRAYRITDVLMFPITRVLQKHARRWNLPGDPSVVLSPLLSVAQCPPGLDFKRESSAPPIAWCGPFRTSDDDYTDVPESDGRPLIFCSLGTLQGGRFGLFRAMAGACADIGARAVIAHCGLLSKAQISALPGDPLVRNFWPQAAILKHVRAAVTHGGFNTVLDALAAGVPMVVVPIAFEQPGTSARLRAAGAAIVVPHRQLTRRRLATALERLLSDDGYRQSAAGFASRLAGLSGADDAADNIMAACAPQQRTAGDRVFEGAL